MFKRVSDGFMIPPWYGVAWRDWQASQTVCLPLGLNVIAGIIRGCYYLLKGGPKWVRDNPRDAFQQGYRCGLEAASKEPT